MCDHLRKFYKCEKVYNIMSSGSNFNRKRQGKKLSDKAISVMKILRTNGLTLDDIAMTMSISVATASKYCKGVTILPKYKQKNPFDLLSDAESLKVLNYDKRTPPVQDLLKAKNVTDIDYYFDNHVEGKKFKAPLHIVDQLPLQHLREAMKIPTGYHSELSMADWIDHYLGDHILKYDPHRLTKLQRLMIDFHLDNRRSMFEAFRGAGKTMIAIGVITYNICENPDGNFFIQSEIDSKAADRVKTVGSILLNNKRIIADYGFLPHIDKYQGTNQAWKASSITVKRRYQQTDPTLMALSWTAAKSTGAHFAGGVYDDVWSIKLETNSEVNKDKWLAWYDGEMQGTLEDDTWELFLLTRKGPSDLYQELEDRGIYAVTKHPAILKYPTEINYTYKEVNGKQIVSGCNFTRDGKLSCTERFGMEFFLMKRKSLATSKWESEYQLNPVANEGKYLSWGDLRFMKTKDDFFELFNNEPKRIRKYTRIYGVMDFAFGRSERAHWNVLGVFAQYNHNTYFLQQYLKRGASNTDRANMIQRAYKEFPYMSMVHAEADLQQSETVRELQKLVPHIFIKEMYSRHEASILGKEKEMAISNLSSKHARIYSQLEVPLQAHRVFINKSMNDFDEFEREFRYFPNYKFDDVIDVMGSAVGISKGSSALLYAVSG